MDEYIHRENLALFRKHLSNPLLSDSQRKIILKLLAEERAKKLKSSENDTFLRGSGSNCRNFPNQTNSAANERSDEI